jgi:hypothetical protein
VAFQANSYEEFLEVIPPSFHRLSGALKHCFPGADTHSVVVNLEAFLFEGLQGGRTPAGGTDQSSIIRKAVCAVIDKRGEINQSLESSLTSALPRQSA